MVGRAAALLVLGTALGLYYAFHDRPWSASTWWDIAFVSFALIPACFGLVWLVLPLWDAPGLIWPGPAFGLAAPLFHPVAPAPPETFCNPFAATPIAFWF